MMGPSIFEVCLMIFGPILLFFIVWTIYKDNTKERKQNEEIITPEHAVKFVVRCDGFKDSIFDTYEAAMEEYIYIKKHLDFLLVANPNIRVHPPVMIEEENDTKRIKR